MHVVPHLREHGAAVVQAALAGLGGVVLGTRAADVREHAVFLGECALDVGEGVGGAVGRVDALAGQPAPGGQRLEVGDDGLEEVDEVLVLAVKGPVALDVKGGEACGVLGELVRPEDPV